MKQIKALFLLAIIGFISITASQAQEFATTKDSLANYISKRIKGVKIKEMECAKPYVVKLELMVPQNLDHTNGNSDTLWQLIYLSHRSFDSPNVIVTEGYGASYAEPANYNEELCKILKANLIFVEHRFFGKSKPATMDWKYLTIKQASADHNQIIKWFKPIYQQKWVATGTSKGGSTALYLKALYPESVDAVVAYVAPITIAQEDPRPIDYIMHRAGTEEERKAITEYQLLMFKKFDKLLGLFNEYSSKNNLTYSMGNQTTLEYLILEYPFSHFQWGVPINKIPTKKQSIKEMLDHLILVVDPDGFSETGSEATASYYYQAYSEVGYYNYNAYIPLFKKYLKKKDYGNYVMVPKGASATYHPESHKEILALLNKNGENILQIHGALDPWYQSAWIPEDTNKLPVFVLQNGSHGVRITYFETETKNKIYETLESWLGLKVKRL